jgi:hypothetical protein
MQMIDTRALEVAYRNGAGVVFADNRARTIEGDGELPDLLVETAQQAVKRAKER